MLTPDDTDQSRPATAHRSLADALRSTAVSRTVRATARRVSWGLADQAVSSMTNFAVGIVVARTLGAVEFGVFSLAWVTYGVILNLSRGLATDPLVVRFSGVPTTLWRAAVSRSVGTALSIGVVGGVVAVLTGLAISGPVGAGFVALGLVLPALLLQDSWRFAFFAAGKGRQAFTNDAVWAVVLIPSLFLAVQAGNVFAFVLAWGFSGAVAAAYGCVQTQLVPRLSGIGEWHRQHRDLGMRYMVENVSMGGASQLRMYGVGAIAGLAAVGTVRGADLLMGPFVAVLMGLSLVAVPEAARVIRRSPRRLQIFCLLLGGAQAMAAATWGMALLFLLPYAAGQYVLGSVWLTASALILPATLSVVNAGFASGAAAGLRALGAAQRSLRVQLLASAAYVTGGLVGAAMGGALGSSWGVAAATLFGAVLWWTQLRAGLRDHMAASPPDPHVAGSAHTDHKQTRTP